MIEKLKIIDVNKYYLVVINPQKKEGRIYISEVAHFYIKDLEEMFNIGDIVYATRVGKFKNYFSYSLKVGHTLENKYENGGGFLVLKNFLEEFEGSNSD